MTPDRKKPGLAFWATVVVVVALLYPISFGPACWINRGTAVGGKAIWTVYYPMLWAANRSIVLDDAFIRYAGLGVSESKTPVFRDRELTWENPVWNALRAKSQSGKYAKSRLAPYLSRQ